MSDATPDHQPLTVLLRGSAYQGYAYAYPHKSAYRRIDPPKSLKDIWRDEPKDALFLYLHIPFCEMRCGFCNLFTQSHTRAGIASEIENSYINALERQSHIMKSAIPDSRFARGAIGGGTPTYLSVPALARLFSVFNSIFNGKISGRSISVEASPFTATPERLAILRDNGVTRISLGVQSFNAAEVAASGRAQTSHEVHQALRSIGNAGYPVVNIDLIYGLPGQTRASWRESLNSALAWKPEELYLYPLYVRPLTGLARRYLDTADEDVEWNAVRLACYRDARTLLLANGYRALSMRHFRRDGCATDSVEYCCQEDGTVALGCGGRSYTRAMHYSNEYAVSSEGVREIIQRFVSARDAEHGHVNYGFELDAREQRRRYVIKSLLRCEGLNLRRCQTFFGSDVLDDIPALRELLEHGLAELQNSNLQLTENGLEFSDVIGPWLGSAAVQDRMQTYILR